jgi:hypothetical protein
MLHRDLARRVLPAAVLLLDADLAHLARYLSQLRWPCTRSQTDTGLRNGPQESRRRLRVATITLYLRILSNLLRFGGVREFGVTSDSATILSSD